MKMKKIIAMLLSVVILLSFVACGAEVIVPKEDDQPDDPDLYPSDNPPADDIPFESGVLATSVDAFCEGLILDNYWERRDEIPETFVTFLETKEQYEAMLDTETVEMIQAQKPEDRIPLAQQACETMDRYTDAFLAEKQVIAITYIERCIGGDCFMVKELIQNEDGTYHLQVALQWETSDSTSSGQSYLFAHTITIEVDRSLGITPENLTVGVWDFRI